MIATILTAVLFIGELALIIRNTRQTKKRGLLIFLLIVTTFFFFMSLGKTILFPRYEEPRVTGEHKVLTDTYTWVDESRIETYTDTGEYRAVTVKFWYPEEEGSYPLVVFSHGAGGILDSNASTCKELASNGYVAVAIAHPYQAAFVEDVNGKVTIVDPEFMSQVTTDNGSDDPAHEAAVYEMSKEWMEIRGGDENFVLDTILTKCEAKEEGAFGRINPDKIGLFGHSLGGATSVKVGRERDDIDAVIDLEGTMLSEYTGYEDGAYLFEETPYPVPLLDVNSRAVYEEASSYGEYVNFYVGEHAVDFKEVIINDAGHMNFCDLSLVSPVLSHLLGVGEVDAKECLENINDMVLNYFNYYLKDAETLNIPDEY